MAVWFWLKKTWSIFAKIETNSILSNATIQRESWFQNAERSKIQIRTIWDGDVLGMGQRYLELVRVSPLHQHMVQTSCGFSPLQLGYRYCWGKCPKTWWNIPLFVGNAACSKQQEPHLSQPPGWGLPWREGPNVGQQRPILVELWPRHRENEFGWNTSDSRTKGESSGGDLFGRAGLISRRCPKVIG